MLVITRREGEKLYINGKEIKLIVLQSTRGKVKLGIEAAANVPVFREELYERIEESKQNQQKKEGEEEQAKQQAEEGACKKEEER